jgi:chromate reductase
VLGVSVGATGTAWRSNIMRNQPLTWTCRSTRDVCSGRKSCSTKHGGIGPASPGFLQGWMQRYDALEQHAVQYLNGLGLSGEAMRQ